VRKSAYYCGLSASAAIQKGLASSSRGKSARGTERTDVKQVSSPLYTHERKKNSLGVRRFFQSRWERRKCESGKTGSGEKSKGGVETIFRQLLSSHGKKGIEEERGEVPEKRITPLSTPGLISRDEERRRTKGAMNELSACMFNVIAQRCQ